MQNANSKFIVRIETCVDCGDEFIIRSEIKFLDRDTFRASSKLLTSPPISLPKTIVFITSGAKTQKKEIIPYPRCGFGACLRCG